MKNKRIVQLKMAPIKTQSNGFPCLFHISPNIQQTVRVNVSSIKHVIIVAVSIICSHWWYQRCWQNICMISDACGWKKTCNFHRKNRSFQKCPTYRQKGLHRSKKHLDLMVVVVEPKEPTSLVWNCEIFWLENEKWIS